MTATTMASNLLIASSPATAALEQAQKKVLVERAVRQETFDDSKLSCSFFSLNFEEDINSFPIIEWENEDSDSDSVRSLDDWNSLLTRSDSSGSLGKRGRGESRNGRLVRCKKIKSDLHSLA